MNNLTETEEVQAQNEPELEKLKKRLRQIEEDIAYTKRGEKRDQTVELEGNRLELLDEIDREKGLYDDPLKGIEK